MKRMIGLGLAASAAILAVVPFASGHATVSLLQPQGKALTAARVAYVVRAPNERAKQDTIMLTMYATRAAVRALPCGCSRLTVAWPLANGTTARMAADAASPIPMIRFMSHALSQIVVGRAQAPSGAAARMAYETLKVRQAPFRLMRPEKVIP